ncbi:MAG: G-D-S-L family lipolytic protein [Lentisphaeria bacterium]|nr:G-D-S-L family lipolytic protein [Lentisphaeria bacterium]
MKYRAIPRTCYPHSKIEEDCYDWWERHAQKVRQAQEKEYDIIFVGDSITHFWHSAEEQQRDQAHEVVWQEFYGKRNVLNLGYGFDRPQNVLWRLENGEFGTQKPKLVILNIGTNCFSITPRYDGDTPEIAFEGVKAVVEKIFELAPETHLLLMEIFPRLPLEIQKKIDQLNALLREFSAGDERITLVSINDKLADNGVLRPELYGDKCCHPNADGYRIWGNAIEPCIKEILAPRN